MGLPCFWGSQDPGRAGPIRGELNFESDHSTDRGGVVRGGLCGILVATFLV
jgi:hypothetical protein